MNDPVDSTTWTFTYDRGGNMLQKCRYAYATGTLGTCLQTITYTYGDSNWKDKLTAYGGEPITYDAQGNVTSFRGYTYTWARGRELAAMTKGTPGTAGYHRVEFVYDEYGHRIQKTSITYDAANARNNYKITDFYWSGDKLVHSKIYSREGESGTLTETADLHYHYDADGKPGIIRYNGTRFMCQYNLQGDIIGLIAGHHTQIVRYEYDAWGRVISITGSGKDDLGVYNPLRYRHYQYDDETGLYYLNSRYYNPELGRFISSDSILDGKSAFKNLFAYCDNKCIRVKDPGGHGIKDVLLEFEKRVENFFRIRILPSFMTASNKVHTVQKQMEKAYMDVCTKAAFSSAAITAAISFEAGVGTGLGGSADLGIVSVSAQYKNDIVNYSGVIGDARLGNVQQISMGFDLNAPAVDNLSKGVSMTGTYYHPYYATNCTCDGPLNYLATCPAVEYTYSEGSALTLGASLYIGVGGNLQISLDTERMWSDLRNIWH